MRSPINARSNCPMAAMTRKISSPAGVEVSTSSLIETKRLDQASRAVEPLDDDGLKLSPSGVGQEPVELGPVLLRARRHIGVRGHEGQPSLSQMLPDLVELDFKVLGLCAHSGVRGHVHRVLVGRHTGSGRQGTTAAVGRGVAPARKKVVLAGI